jgi:hypothetical protein
LEDDAIPLFPHYRKRGTRCVDHSVEASVHDALEILVADLLEGAEAAVTRVIDQHIQPSECIQSRLDRRDRVIRVGDVLLYRKYSVAILPDQILQLLWLAGGGNDSFARTQRSFRNTSPQTIRAACNEPYLGHCDSCF